MRNWASQPQRPVRNVRFCLVFPRESLSIPVMRRVLGDTLSRLGVDEESIGDLLLAVTEACTNVLRHAGADRGYEVIVQVDRSRCVLQVLDNGHGIDRGRVRVRRAHLRRGPARPVARLRRHGSAADITQLAESGRGLAIMRACVDDVSLKSGPGKGTVVRMRKRIEWKQDAPLTDSRRWALRDAG